MEQIWNELYQAAKAVQNPRDISERISAGGVAAAIQSASGKIYTGVCVDTSSSLGICAERNAIQNAISHGDRELVAIAVVGKMKDKDYFDETLTPCGMCRQYIIDMCKDIDIICYIEGIEKVLKPSDLLAYTYDFDDKK